MGNTEQEVLATFHYFAGYDIVQRTLRTLQCVA